MTTIFDVAEWFILMCDDIEYQLDISKLQALCYYAKARYKKLNNKDLFKENFKVTLKGVKNIKIFEKYKFYNYYLQHLDDNINFKLKRDEIEILEDIWEGYGKYTGKYLEKLIIKEYFS